MADHMKFKLDGFKEMEKRLVAIGEEMATKAGQAAVRASAKTLMDELKQTVPVSDEEKRSPMSQRYGRLKDNLKIRKGKTNKPHTVASIVTIGAAFWGRFQEFGTVKMIARPWFKPAFDNVRDKVANELQTNLGKALDRIVKKMGGK